MAECNGPTWPTHTLWLVRNKKKKEEETVKLCFAHKKPTVIAAPGLVGSVFSPHVFNMIRRGFEALRQPDLLTSTADFDCRRNVPAGQRSCFLWTLKNCCNIGRLFSEGKRQRGATGERAKPTAAVLTGNAASVPVKCALHHFLQDAGGYGRNSCRECHAMRQRRARKQVGMRRPDSTLSAT